MTRSLLSGFARLHNTAVMKHRRIWVCVCFLVEAPAATTGGSGVVWSFIRSSSVLAVCYHDGLGVDIDKETALKICQEYKKYFAPALAAVDEGYAAGLFAFGQLLESGFNDWPADEAAAVECYHRAGVEGHGAGAERSLVLKAKLLPLVICISFGFASHGVNAGDCKRSFSDLLNPYAF